MNKAFIKITQNNIINSIKKIQIFILCSSILIIPYLAYYNMGGRGYELAKVNGLYTLTAIISSANLIVLTFQLKIYRFKIVHFIRHFLNIKYINILYWLLFICLIIFNNLVQGSDITIFGNYWRSQGLILYLAIFFLSIQTWFIISKSNYFYFLATMVINGIIQSLISIQQINKYLYTENIDKLLNGFYINGTYGQTNFVTYSTLISFIAIFWILIHGKYKLVANIFIKAILTILLVTIAISIFFSGSLWSILVLILSILAIIISKYIQAVNIKYLNFVLYIFVLIIIFAPAISLFFPENVSNLRLDIWKNIFVGMQISGLHSFLLGVGFDNLGEWLKINGLLSHFYIDRAHNFFIDIILSFGLIPFVLFVKKFFTILSITTNKIKSEEYLLITLILVWLVKSVVNEFSIFNVWELILLLVILDKLKMINNRNTLETSGIKY
jgi:hypothetical protein